MKLRVAAYCRVSTDQEDQQSSLVHQRQYFKEYIERQPDWELVSIFVDEGFSGTSTRNRPGFQQMLEAARAGKIDLIVTKEVSRFARNTIDTLAHTRELRKQGVGVLFINDNIDTRQNDGEFRLTIMASVAQEESRKISERVKWGQKRSMEQGVVFGCNNMYGYELKGGRLTVRPEEAAVVRLIYHKFLDEGKGTFVIARELYEAGIAPPKAKDKPWSSVMILRILRNEKYCGDLLQKKSYTPSFLEHKKVRNDGTEEMDYIPDHHEAIISRDVFERTQAELARRAPTEEQKARYSSQYWCSGKIICGGCGKRFVPRRRKRADNSEYFYWVCHAKSDFGSYKIDAQGNAVGCDMRGLNNEVVCACMIDVANRLQLDNALLIDEIIQLIAQTSQAMEDDDGGESKRLQAQKQRLTQKLDAVLDSYFDQVISKTEMERLRDRYHAELERIDARLQELERREQASQDQQQELEELRVFLANSVLQSEAVWGELLERMTVYPDYVAVKLYALPVTFYLKFRTSGRGKEYQVVITDCKVKSEPLL